MHIYLKHEQHGRKVATMEAEAEYDELNGWVRYNPDTLPVQDIPAFLNQMRPTLHVTKRQKSAP